MRLFRVKLTGIRRRWMFNSISAVLLIILLAVCTFSLVLFNYFYSSMTASLNAKAQTATSFFSKYDTREEYLRNASYFTSSFPDKDKLELQFISAYGRIQFSSYGLAAGTTIDTPDISDAITTGRMRTWTGRDPETREHIMAVSSPAVLNGQVVGVIRYVTSLRTVDRHIALSVVSAILVGTGIVAMVYFSNLYFIHSIVDPVADLTRAAQRIAAGSYGVKIEKKFDDEIGVLTDTINDMSMKIRQSEKLKSEFLSSVSHELRTPLTAINGWSETLASGELKDEEEVKKGLNIILSESRRLTKMVEELLEFSRLESGHFTLQIEPMDIRAELEESVYTYQEFFRKKGIELHYEDSGEEIPEIPGDPERLKQVFSNLLDNAAKHGGSGGRIDVSIGSQENNVVIRIRDYGPGIPEEDLPQVKLMFYKGSTKARGSGIGLAVCEDIVTRHNGRLDISNAQGGGTLVTIVLPMRN